MSEAQQQQHGARLTTALGWLGLKGLCVWAGAVRGGEGRMSLEGRWVAAGGLQVVARS